MANGYIGKISAVVTANTSDLSRKLQGAVGDVDKFANRIAASIERSSKNAADSLDRIFTPLQRLQRNIQAGLAGNVFRRDNVEQYIRSVQQAVSISEQLGKPLASVASQFQKLSLEVQGAFLPALNRAQSAVINLSTTLQQQGSVSERSFGQVEAVVNRTTQAIQRLTQAQQLASQSLTGNELQFGNPRLFETLSANARTTQRAAALPADALVDGSIARQVRALQQYQNAAVEAAARVESLRLEPNVNPEVLLAAERRLESIIETARRAGEQVRNAVEISENIGASTQLRSTTDPTGRSIQERARDIQSAAEATERRRVAEAALRSEQEARLAVANSLLQVDQRESQLTSLEGAASTRDATGRSIQERARDIQSAAEATERRRQAEAALRSEQEARLAVANSLLQVDQRESELITNQGVASGLGNRLAEQGRRRVRGLTGNVNLDATDILGGQAQRDIDALAARVGDVRQQLETLPNSVRTQFIPALQQAQQELIRLQNSPTATVNQINQASAAVQRLEQNARRAATAFDFRSQFGGAGIEGIEDGLNQQALRGYTAQLQLLQQTLAGTSQAARGPAVQAFDRLRTAIANSMENGTIATEGTRRVIRQLTTEAANAAAAAANISPGALNRRLQRVGDIGRGSFGNIGLAVQQAAFIVDDFFSVTGGLDQRLRAIGNNISQLGFVLGGTAGLVAGVAASVTSQLLVAFIKWQNGGAGTEDQVKSLNDALARQKSLVESLAQAYQSVADAIERSGFTQETQELRERSKLIDDIRRKQAEIAQGRIADLDPAVQRERGIQAARQRELDAAVDPGERVRLAREIAASRDREEAAAAAAVARPAANAQQIAESVAAARLRVQEAQINAAAAGAQAGSGPGGANAEIARRRREQIDQARAAAAEFAAAQGDRLAGIRDPRQRAAAAVELIDQQQAEISSQITTGIQGFFDGANAARRQELARLERERATVEQVIFGGAANDLAVQGVQQALDVSSAIGESLAILGNVIGSGGTQIASDLERANQSLLAAERRLSAAAESGDLDAAEAARREIEATANVVAELESLARSTATFAATLDRISTQLANTVAQEARSAADQARRDANAAAAQVDRGGGGVAAFGDQAFADRQRRRAEENARQAEDRAAEVQAQNARVRDDFERDARRGGLGAQTQRLIEERDAIDAVLRGDIAASEEQRQEARRRRDEIDRQLDRQFEDSPAGREARDRGDEADRRRAADAQRADDIARGRELSRSPAEQAGRQLAADLRALAAARDEALAAGGRQAPIQQGFAADRRRLIDDAFRAAAPAIFALSDQVENALVQGPSRAALQATDVSSVEGARELNRLLRGEDGARDQNLVELQKQSQSLDELVRIAREGGAQIAP